MSDETKRLKERIEQLEGRQAKAILQLHCLANEMVHNMSVDWDDLQEVIDLLTDRE